MWFGVSVVAAGTATAGAGLRNSRYSRPPIRCLRSASARMRVRRGYRSERRLGTDQQRTCIGQKSLLVPSNFYTLT